VDSVTELLEEEDPKKASPPPGPATEAKANGDKEETMAPASGAPAKSTKGKAFPSDGMTAYGSAMSEGSASMLIGFGYQKCATTFVTSIIHPLSVDRKTSKELHYLTGGNSKVDGQRKESHCQKTEYGDIIFDGYVNDCFAGHFPKPGEMLMDWTPEYGSPEVADEFVRVVHSMMAGAANQNTEVKLIAMLRNPVERVISETDMMRRTTKRKSKDRHISLQSTDAELDEILFNHVSMASRRWTEPKHGYPESITFGEYNQSLSVVLKSFPKESVLLVNIAKLPELEVWRRIYAHAGLVMPKAGEFNTLWERQVSKTQKKSAETFASEGVTKYKASEKVVSALTNYYKPFDQQLWKLIGQTWW
jgi:hypothetical protein